MYFSPITFVHRTPDPQLNNILETYALALNQLGSMVQELYTYRVPVNAVTVPNFAQLSPTAGTPYLVGTADVYVGYNQVQISVNCTAALAFTTGGGSSPTLTLRVVRKLQSSPSYNIPVDTVASYTFTPNATYTGATTLSTNFAVGGLYDKTAVDYYQYGVFLSYNDVGTPVTASGLSATNIGITVAVLR